MAESDRQKPQSFVFPERVRRGPKTPARPPSADRRVNNVLWRSDGARYERIEASATLEGGLYVRERDMGASDWAVFGADEYEATLEFAPADVVKLALALLSAGFAGNPDALARLEAFCKAEGVAFRFGVWT